MKRERTDFDSEIRSRRHNVTCFEDEIVTSQLRTDPEIIRNVIANILNVERVNFSKMFGRGAFGIVVGVCIPGDDREVVAAKISLSNSSRALQEMDQEAKMQKLFYENGLGPDVLGFSKNPLVLVMEALTGILGQWLELKRSQEELEYVSVEVLQLIQKMSELNLSHSDLHWGNIGYKDSISNLLLIDFGHAKTGSNRQLELAQIIRSTFSRYSKKRNPSNMSYLRNRFITEYKNHFLTNPDFDMSLEYWDLVCIRLKSSKTTDITSKDIEQLLLSVDMNVNEEEGNLQPACAPDLFTNSVITTQCSQSFGHILKSVINTLSYGSIKITNGELEIPGVPFSIQVFDEKTEVLYLEKLNNLKFHMRTHAHRFRLQDKINHREIVCLDLARCIIQELQILKIVLPLRLTFRFEVPEFATSNNIEIYHNTYLGAGTFEKGFVKFEKHGSLIMIHFNMGIGQYAEKEENVSHVSSFQTPLEDEDLGSEFDISPPSEWDLSA
jgi:hypothetical protein